MTIFATILILASSLAGPVDTSTSWHCDYVDKTGKSFALQASIPSSPNNDDGSYKMVETDIAATNFEKISGRFYANLNYDDGYFREYQVSNSNNSNPFVLKSTLPDELYVINLALRSNGIGHSSVTVFYPKSEDGYNYVATGICKSEFGSSKNSSENSK